jgi:hypothetical protein
MTYNDIAPIKKTPPNAEHFTNSQWASALARKSLPFSAGNAE